jgi:hypothetical protein
MRDLAHACNLMAVCIFERPGLCKSTIRVSRPFWLVRYEHTVDMEVSGTGPDAYPRYVLR